jgi:hypothetical protein
MDIEDETYCRIETAKGNFIVLAFDQQHHDLLRAASRRGSFTLVVEGMVPVEVPTPPGNE